MYLLQLPPLSQPRPASSSMRSVEMGGNHTIEQDENSTEDLFEGFDVLESEKDFLLSLLDVAPAEEVEALNGVTHTKFMEEVEFYVAPASRSTVEEFTHTHPFWSRGQHLDMGKSIDSSEVEMLEFKQDVYDYARAAGMGQHQAKVEVMRAAAAWRKERGFVGGEVLHEWEKESKVEPEIYARSTLLVARPTMPLVSSGATKTEPSKKRKRGSLEEPTPQNLSSQVVEPDVPETKRLRKIAKKERKKAARDMRKQLCGIKGAVGTSNHTKDQSPVFSLLPKPPIAEKETVNQPAKKKKKSKLGPTISAYFAKPQIPDPMPEKEPTMGPSGLTDAAKPSNKSKRVRKRQRAAGRLGTGSKVSHPTSVSTKIQRSIEEDVPAIADHPLPIPAPALMPESSIEAAKPTLTDLDAAKSLVDVALEVNEKKSKRKRKRNHNRLPEERAPGFSDQSKTDFSKPTSTSQEAAKLYTEKRSCIQAFIENLQDVHHDQGSEHLSGAHAEDGEDVKTESKRKRTRRRKLSRQEVCVAPHQSQDSMPSDHDADILIVPDDGSAVAEKHDNIENEPRLKKHRRKELPKKKEPIVLDQFQDTVANSSDTEMPIVRTDGIGEADERQVNSVVILEHEEISPSSKKRCRDRGRKSKVMQKESLKLVETQSPEEQAVVEPLAELANTNTKQPKDGMRERGRGRTRESDDYSEMEVDASSLRGQSKVHHS